jgi:hypothetical protein
MPAFRPLPPLFTFHGLTGQLLPDGYLKFYVAGTTTPANVYGDEAMETNNGPTIQLDASSRANVQIWGDTAVSYDVEIYAADDSIQGSAENLSVPGGTGTAIPELVDGEFITSDGSQLLFAAIRQVLDPTGQNNKILGVVGDALAWVAKPANGANGTSDTSATSTSFKVGSFLGQTGSDTAPASSNKTTTKNVTFAKAYDSAPVFIGIDPVDGGNTPSGVFPIWNVTARSTTGFTVTFDTTTGGTSADNQAGSDITDAINFKYFALGVRAAA